MKVSGWNFSNGNSVPKKRYLRLILHPYNTPSRCLNINAVYGLLNVSLPTCITLKVRDTGRSSLKPISNYIRKVIRSSWDTVAYSDVIVLKATGKHFQILIDLLQNGLYTVCSWYSDYSLYVNALKIKLEFFPRRHKPSAFSNPSAEVKYLDPILDSKLTWNRKIW